MAAAWTSLPRGPQYPVSLRTWAHSNTPLTMVDAPPAPPPGKSSPPNPVRATVQRYALNQPTNPLLFPPYNYWGYADPVPPGPRYPVSLRTWTQNTNPLLFAPSNNLFGMAQPVPRGPQQPYSLYSITSGLNWPLINTPPQEGWRAGFTLEPHNTTFHIPPG